LVGLSRDAALDLSEIEAESGRFSTGTGGTSATTRTEDGKGHPVAVTDDMSDEIDERGEKGPRADGREEVRRWLDFARGVS